MTDGRRAYPMQPTLQDVARASALLRQDLPADMDAADSDRVELGVAEALTNIVRHGCARSLRLELAVTAESVRVDIWDDGAPIPPHVLDSASVETFDFDHTDVGGLPEGGLGLAIMKAAFEGVRYASAGGENHLALERRLRTD